MPSPTSRLMLEQADTLSLHLPLIPETRHRPSTGTLARMKAGALPLNTNRGKLMDTSELVEALG